MVNGSTHTKSREARVVSLSNLGLRKIKFFEKKNIGIKVNLYVGLYTVRCGQF